MTVICLESWSAELFILYFGKKIIYFLLFALPGFSYRMSGHVGYPVFHRQNSRPLQALCSDLQHLQGNAENLNL